MAYTVIIHLTNEEPILGEIEEMPKPADNSVTCTGLRRRDGKSLAFVTPEATTFIFPWHRISFLEILPSEEEREEIIEFFRD